MRKQIALCIGNDDYQYTCLQKLSCAVNDSCAMGEKLKSLGFDVICKENLKRDDMYCAADELERKLPDYDTVLFYFAGHGFESDGKNLLIPIDAQDRTKEYAHWMAFDLQYLIECLQGKKIPNHIQTKIIILDACRESAPERGNRTRGFAPVFAPEGTIIAFSTSPGQSAKEDNGHGLFTGELIQFIDLPRIPIENMFKHVRETLSSKTHGEQISWEHTSLMGNYCFNEDSIDAFSFYATQAFADGSFYFSTGSTVGKISEELKSRDWYRQNPAISMLTNENLQTSSPSELFVLGRNIYQASVGGAWRAQEFIDTFQRVMLTDDIKKHLLCGMVYEIYYDKKGTIRDSFKSDFYLMVLKHLYEQQFQMCKSFISAILANETSRLIFIPSSEERMAIHIECVKASDDELPPVYNVQGIYYQGKNYLLYKDKYDKEICIFGKKLSKGDLINEISKLLIIPPDMLIVSIPLECPPNAVYRLPPEFAFTLSYGNVCQDDPATRKDIENH